MEFKKVYAGYASEEDVAAYLGKEVGDEFAALQDFVAEALDETEALAEARKVYGEDTVVRVLVTVEVAGAAP